MHKWRRGGRQAELGESCSGLLDICKGTGVVCESTGVVRVDGPEKKCARRAKCGPGPLRPCHASGHCVHGQCHYPRPPTIATAVEDMSTLEKEQEGLATRLETTGWRRLAHAIRQGLEHRVQLYGRRAAYFRQLGTVVQRCKPTAADMSRLDELGGFWVEQRSRVHGHLYALDTDTVRFERLESQRAEQVEQCLVKLRGADDRLDVRSAPARRCLMDLTRARLDLSRLDADWGQLQFDWTAGWADRDARWAREHDDNQLRWYAWVQTELPTLVPGAPPWMGDTVLVADVARTRLCPPVFAVPSLILPASNFRDRDVPPSPTSLDGPPLTPTPPPSPTGGGRRRPIFRHARERRDPRNGWRIIA